MNGWKRGSVVRALGTRGRRRGLRSALCILLLACLVPVSRSMAAAPSSPWHGRVDVGGYKMYLECVGSGSPTVVLDDQVVDPWRTVEHEVGSYTRVCAYDRAGLGGSDLGPLPTSTGQMVRETRRLLANAHIPGPYLLVGGPFGGMTMRLYASRYRREVVGLVLVDVIHEDLFSKEGIDFGDDIDVAKSRAQLRASARLGSLPLVVLSHGIRYSYAQSVERVWPRYQRKLERLSSNHVHVIAVHSGAAIAEDQPMLVSEAIFQVIEASRRPSHRLQPCGVWFTSRGGSCAS